MSNVILVGNKYNCISPLFKNIIGGTLDYWLHVNEVFLNLHKPLV